MFGSCVYVCCVMSCEGQTDRHEEVDEEGLKATSEKDNCQHRALRGRDRQWTGKGWMYVWVELGAQSAPCGCVQASDLDKR